VAVVRRQSLALGGSVTVQVSVLYFGGLKEALGCSREVIGLNLPNPTLADLYEVLGQRHHGLSALLLAVRLAVNEEFIQGAGLEVLSSGVPLAQGDVVAFIPPVTGG
jgi:molybdopterin converting factor small subunit